MTDSTSQANKDTTTGNAAGGNRVRARKTKIYEFVFVEKRERCYEGTVAARNKKEAKKLIYGYQVDMRLFNDEISNIVVDKIEYIDSYESEVEDCQGVVS